MIVEDFCGEAVLERLQRYERRIESSFYKALNELRQALHQRQEAALEAPPTPARWGKEDWEAKKACKTNPMCDRISLERRMFMNTS
jgi:hypothetical protein